MSTKQVQKYFIFTIGIVLLITIVTLKSFTQRNSKTKGGTSMELRCTEFQNNEFIPEKFSCKGEDINPKLAWDGVPENTKSFALSIKDPDAPMGTFVHWLVFDIDKDTREIEENTIPGKQVKNNFGKEDYGGPCPPSGVHRYYFRLHALDVETLGEINSMEDFDKKVEQHTLEMAELMGKFEK